MKDSCGSSVHAYNQNRWPHSCHWSFPGLLGFTGRKERLAGHTRYLTSLKTACKRLGLIQADMSVLAGLRGDVRGEWDEMKQHDVVFLLTVRPPDQAALQLLRADGAEPSPADVHGLFYVRGAEVIEVGECNGYTDS